MVLAEKSHLRAAEALAQLSLDALSAHVAILDEDGDILLVNRAWRDFARENSLACDNVSEGANYFAICDGARGPGAEGAADFAEGIRAVLSGRRIQFALEYPCSSPEEERWFVGRVTRLPDKGVNRVVVAHENITARKLAELELAESRRQLSLALDSADMGVWHWDIRTGKRHFDARTCRLLGLDPRTFRGTADEFFGALHPKDRDHVKAALTATLDHDAPYNVEYRVTWSDGRQHYISARGRLLRDELGTPIQIDGIAWDQTERVLAELALSRSEERFRQLAEIFPETVFEADLSGKVNYVNEHGLKAFHATQADVDRGVNIIDLVLPEERSQLMHRMERLVAGEPGGFREYGAVRLNGEAFDALARATPILEHGRVVGIRGFILDISERKRAEKALLESNHQLEAASRRAMELAAQAEQASTAKGEFLANMSHEIRTPMNGVIGMIGLLLDTDLSLEQRRYAEAVRRSGDALLALINDILDYSKIQAGKLTFESVDFDLWELLDDLLEVTVPSAQEKRLELVRRVPREVPRFLRGAPGRLRQVLANLLSNAIKFTACGEIALEVRVLRSSVREVALRFAVSDTGIGVPADRQAAIFEKFTQVDASTTRRSGGTGLGLAISKQLIELMGGAIGVNSDEGRGSEFWCDLRFDLSTQDSAASPRTDPRGLEGSLLGETNGAAAPCRDPLDPGAQDALRVLVAEDNITNQQVALGLLRKLGHRGDVVATGREALEALRSTAYDLVLMDVQMPEMDGFEATAAIRNDVGTTMNPAIPIIAMTAHSMQGDREKCLAIGMNDYLAKPVVTSELARLLDKWRGRSDFENGTGRVRPGSAGCAREKSSVFAEPLLLQRLMGDRRLARLVLLEFLTDLPKRIDAIGGFLAANDAANVERQAHAIKGAAATVCGEALFNVAQRIEIAGRAGRLVEMRAGFYELKRRVDEFEGVAQGSSLMKDIDRSKATLRDPS